MKILISGAGIAGLTLAYWLKRYGFDPTVIEVAPNLKNRGYMMDFFGEGIPVAEAMGIIPELRALDCKIDGFMFMDSNGKRLGGFDREAIRSLFSREFFNIMRGDLEDLLYRHVRDTVPVRFASSIDRIEQDPESVQVRFVSGQQERYDLVIGADGIHSRVRQLVFGADNDFSQFLGLYVASFILPDSTGLENNFYASTGLGRTAMVYPIGDGLVAPFFTFTSPDRGYVEPADRKDVLKEVFKDDRSFISALLEDIDPTDVMFFDAVRQIRMPRWTNGRVGLVGDAGACLTLLAGQGATMAMTEAYILAAELEKADGNHTTAFARYEEILRPVVAKKQADAVRFAGSFVPQKNWTLWVYKHAMRFMHYPFVLRWAFRGFNEPTVFDTVYPISDTP